MIREKVIELAYNEILYTEDPINSNKTKYGQWFGLDGLPWCGIFVSWIYDKAGLPLPKIGFDKGFASCQMAVNYYRDKKRITLKPKLGDLVFFDWDKNGRYDHVGIVTDLLTYGIILTIEGNTSIKSDRNGGSVMQRVRNRKLNMLFINPFDDETI